MKIKKLLKRVVGCGLLAGVMALGLGAQTPAAHKTENVIVVMIDGMRWQEVFGGADAGLLKVMGPAALGDPKERAAQAEDELNNRKLVRTATLAEFNAQPDVIQQLQEKIDAMRRHN